MLVNEVISESKAIHLTKLGKFHKGGIDPLGEYVPERLTHTFALHPEKWEHTFYSLTLKEPKKLRYYKPVEIDIKSGTLVGDMALANQFYWAKDPKEKLIWAQKYKDSLKPYPVDVAEYRYPELLIPKT